jgi:phage baseplate assembly protein V
MMDLTAKLLEPLRRMVRFTARRALVTLVNATGPIQAVQVTLRLGEAAGGVAHLQPYGFASVPEPGAEGIVLAICGDPGHLVAVVIDDRRYRPTDLAAGESAHYGKSGARVTMKADGSIALKPAAGKPVTVEGDLEVDGNLEVTGDIAAAGNVAAQGAVSDAAGTMQEMRDVFNPHVHPENNGSGGPNTSPPTTQMT